MMLRFRIIGILNSGAAARLIDTLQATSGVTDAALHPFSDSVTVQGTASVADILKAASAEGITLDLIDSEP